MSFESELGHKSINTILLENRIINIVGEINDEIAYSVTSALHIMNNENKTKEIQIFINSPGGSCVAGLAIIDTMRFIEAPVVTICTGMAASMGAAILVCGDKRLAMPNSRILFHQASSGMGRSNIQDARIVMQEFEEINDRLATIIADRVGMDKKKYLKTVTRDLCSWPEKFLPGVYGTKGAIDEIIQPTVKNI